MEVKTKVERFYISGPAGRLEALLEFDPRWHPRATAMVCHPHPLFGGTMHNKVVFRAAKAALQAGLPTLRFNFRGTGKSQGKFADGIGEREDVGAALGLLSARYPQAPVCLIGFSFGAGVGLAVGVREPRVVALVGLAVPVGSWDFDFLRASRKPLLIVQGTEDIYGPRDKLEPFFASLSEPKRLHWVEGADHFFTGKLEAIRRAIRTFLEEITRELPQPGT